ncbi:MAG: hypothetical protein ACT4QC_17265 [Planctomycetaceae bacterium]
MQRSPLPDENIRSSRTGPRRLSISEWGVLAFNVCYLLAALCASFFRQNDEFLFYFVVMCLLLTGVAVLHLRIRLSTGALWGLSLWGLAHMAGGLLSVPETWPIQGESRVLYNWWLVPGFLKFDQVVHAFGFGIVTWVCWQCLSRAFDRRGIALRPTLGFLTLCIAAGMGFGAVNEVVEFIATKTLPDTNVGGYDNTGWDLVANLVGCSLAALLIYSANIRREDRAHRNRPFDR